MYTDITSFEDACKDQKKNPKALPDYSKAEMTDGEIRFNLAVFKLARINVSLNKDKKGKPWVPKPGEIRHYPWMWWEKKKGSSASGLSLNGVGCVGSDATVASRLTCREEAIAKYFFETFKDLFEDMIIFHP